MFLLFYFLSFYYHLKIMNLILSSFNKATLYILHQPIKNCQNSNFQSVSETENFKMNFHKTISNCKHFLNEQTNLKQYLLLPNHLIGQKSNGQKRLIKSEHTSWILQREGSTYSVRQQTPNFKNKFSINNLRFAYSHIFNKRGG